jgi:hypothetical protein
MSAKWDFTKGTLDALESAATDELKQKPHMHHYWSFKSWVGDAEI